MVSFYIYDFIFLAMFCLFVIFFIRSGGKKIQREGIIFMYRTQTGIRAINWFSNKFKKILHPLKYLIIATGFVLMAGMLWMLGIAVSTYLFVPEITKVVKAPPIAPLIPYFPEIFGLKSFFPSFYFAYFIIAIAIVAIVHEFAHGIYMKLFKIKIKSTGIVFLGPFLGAFVEEEKKQFEKKKKIEQMSVLGAGVFANVLTALVFLILLVGIYNFGFTQGGYAFNTYASRYINFSEMEPSDETIKLNALLLGQQRVLNFTRIKVNETNYFVSTEGLQLLQTRKNGSVLAFYDAPAIREGLLGGVIEIDGIKINNASVLAEFLKDKSPGEKITITTDIRGQKTQKEIILAEHPLDSSNAFLGISYIPLETINKASVVGKLLGDNYLKFREPNIRGDEYFATSLNGGLIIFIYDLIWWVILINFLVALFNMLPVGILDGGRFFYLAILSLTRSERFAKKTYKFLGLAILFAFVLMMLFYIFRMII